MKQKYGIVFILIFINFAAAFAQKKEVAWHGYKVESESKDFIGEKDIYNIIFLNALIKLDENNRYLNIIIGYDEKVPTTDCPYNITGTIKQFKGNMYIIITDLWHNKIMVTLPGPDSPRRDISEIALHAIIRQEAKRIYDYFEASVRIEKEGNLQLLLADFNKEYMHKIDSMNIEEFNQALQRLSIMEDKFGKSDEISNLRREIEYFAVAVLLARAEEKIDLAFDRRISDDSSESFCNEAEILALQVRHVIEQSKDSSFRSRLGKVESKIDEYRKKAQFAVYTGGLGLFIQKPLPFNLGSPDIDFQKIYPGILGLNLRYVIPFYLPLQWYFQFSYTGGSMKEIPVAWLTEAAIHFLSLSTGMHLQFYINRIIAPYGYFGMGYTHLIEYAYDGEDKAFLNFPGMIMDVGFGTRFHLTSSFALEAKAEWNLIVSQGFMMAVNFSLGGSYLFRGKEYLIRR